MEYQVEVSARALREAQEVHERIAESAPRTAARWYDKLFEKIASLATLPERCSIAAESEGYGCEVRQLLYGKRHNVYRILFTVREDVVEVLSIHHARRGPARL